MFLTLQLHTPDIIKQCCVFLCQRWKNKAEHVECLLDDCVLLCRNVVQLLD
jgi:hypothetical protein